MRKDRLDKLDGFLDRLLGPGIEPLAEKCVSDARIEELCERLGARIAALREGCEDMVDLGAASVSGANGCADTAADHALPQRT